MRSHDESKAIVPVALPGKTDETYSSDRVALGGGDRVWLESVAILTHIVCINVHHRCSSSL